MVDGELITAKSARLKQKWRAGQPSFGVTLTLTDPACAEIMAQSGFDFAFIDMEHTTLDPHLLHGLLMAFGGSETVPLVRVASHDPAEMKRVWDVGAGGVIVPMVNSAAEARAVVAACKYPPQGTRNIGPRRASHYYRDMIPYWRVANAALIVVLLVEHCEAVANIDEILRVDGIDAILIGPGDLALSMGLLDQMQHSDVQQAIDRVLDACKGAGMPAMIGTAPDVEQIRRLIGKGCHLLVLGMDTDFLWQGACNALRKAQEALAATGGK
jgi:2-keto-3-deoxy-L-rhamnonate aldolase RhmA